MREKRRTLQLFSCYPCVLCLKTDGEKPLFGMTLEGFMRPLMLLTWQVSGISHIH